MHKLRSYLLGLQRLGIEPESVLPAGGITWDDVRQLKPLPPDASSLVIGKLIGSLPEDSGIASGLNSAVRDFGMVAYAMLTCPTIRDSYELWSRYSSTTAHPVMAEVIDSGAEDRIFFHLRNKYSFQMARFFIEYSMACFISGFQEKTGLPCPRVTLCLPFREPSNLARYNQLAQFNLEFNANVPASIIVDKSVMDTPLIDSHDNLMEVLTESGLERLRRRQMAPLRERVWLALEGMSGPMTLQTVAKRLGMDTCAVKSGLAREGERCERIINSYRRHQVKALASEGSWAAKEIAWRLGFSSVNNLRRAHRRWSAQTAL